MKKSIMLSDFMVEAEPEDLDACQNQLSRLEDTEFSRRIWEKDTSLWIDDPNDMKNVGNGLGWLNLPDRMDKAVSHLEGFAREIREDDFERVIHIGMGGSSLTALTLSQIFSPGSGGIPLTVLDTIDPSTILELETKINLSSVLFIIASKSGTTLETIELMKYFWFKIASVTDHPGKNFVLITDPGTALTDEHLPYRFRRHFINYSDVGGRYSALSYFGLVPAALMDLNIRSILASAATMKTRCSQYIKESNNPGIALGTIIAQLAIRGRDKLTFLVPDSFSAFAMWIEQLLGESSGGNRVAVIPIVREEISQPDRYSLDRHFVYYDIGINGDLDKKVNRLRDSIHPITTIKISHFKDIGQEFFRWEFAVATMASILGLRAFTEPQVDETKRNTTEILNSLKEVKVCATEAPAIEHGTIKVFGTVKSKNIETALTEFLRSARPGDYVSVQAYLQETDHMIDLLAYLRNLIGDKLSVATTLGFGPRFLHSTGQIHKGGPNTGLFLQLVTEDSQDIMIPGSLYSFGMLRAAQATGDRKTLENRGRRVLCVNLGQHPIDNLRFITHMVAERL